MPGFVSNSLAWAEPVGNDRNDPIKQKIHSVGELVVAFVFVGRGGLAGGLDRRSVGLGWICRVVGFLSLVLLHLQRRMIDA